MQMHRLLACVVLLTFCVLSVNALNCYYGADDDIEERSCPEFQSSCSKSTITDPDTGTVRVIVIVIVIVNSKTYVRFYILVCEG